MSFQAWCLSLVFAFVLVCPPETIRAEDKAPAKHNYSKWEPEITGYEAADKKTPPPKGGIVFIGSSTIKLWKNLAQDFPDHPVINRGFGGSEIIDSTHFADRLIFPHAPRQIFLRAGGNDIHAGHSPEKVAADFEEFVRKVHGKLPETEIVYIFVSPAPARWNENERYQELNARIAKFAEKTPGVKVLDAYNISLNAAGEARPELFVADKLHFNAEGYKILADKVRPVLLPPK